MRDRRRPGDRHRHADELTRGGAEDTLRFGRGWLDVRALAAAADRMRVSEAQPGHYLVEGPVDPQLLATVTAWCAAPGVMAEDLRVQRRTLEDVFLELTGRELRRTDRTPDNGRPAASRPTGPSPARGRPAG